MKLRSLLDRDVLRGAVAFLPWDALKELPAHGGCMVSVMDRNGAMLQDAVPHTSGLYGFLKLSRGSYQVLIRSASSSFLPSLRSIDVPLPAGSSVILPAPLRPSSSYPHPDGATALRGTVHWKRAQTTPARWAAVFARLEALKGATWRVVHSTWTRTDGSGDFAVFLHAASPGAEGGREKLRAIVEIHASQPGDPSLSNEDLSDLVLDDGTEADVRSRQPLAGPPIIVSENVLAGATLSLNQDEYTTQPTRSTPPLKHRVILLS